MLGDRRRVRNAGSGQRGVFVCLCVCFCVYVCWEDNMAWLSSGCLYVPESAMFPGYKVRGGTKVPPLPAISIPWF